LDGQFFSIGVAEGFKDESLKSPGHLKVILSVAKPIDAIVRAFSNLN
jgi:hypothetical protein